MRHPHGNEAIWDNSKHFFINALSSAVRDGNDSLPQWQMEAPADAADGSVKAWVAVTNSFRALPFEVGLGAILFAVLGIVI